MNLFAISGLLAAITSAAMATLMFAQGKERVHYLWGIFSISVGWWSFGAFKIATSLSSTSALLWWKIAYVGVIFIPVLFTHFVLSFLKIESKKLIRILYIFGGCFLVLNFFTTQFISTVSLKFNQIFYLIADKPIYDSFVAFFVILVVYSHILLTKAYISGDSEKRAQIKLLFIATAFGFLGGSFSFLPEYGINIYPYLNFAMFPFAPIVTYTIIRHKLFDIKSALAELFVGILWVVLVFRVFLSENQSDTLINLGILVSALIIGVFLIKSVLKEVQTRERMEALATELAEANERLMILDRQKSEFLSIASHQLRTPLTAIKGYSSMVLEGSFGVVAPKLKEAIERIFLSSERLIIIIEDFLNVSRIEQGRMQYDFATVNLEELTEGVIKDMEPNIKKSNLTVQFKKNSPGPFYITADFGKIRQVVTNIIDNAIKYTPAGGITVELDKDDDTRKILLSISDTGIGIARDVLPNLFQKFSRAKNAGLVNTSSTGLGLYIVKEMMRAHKGNVWVDSPGEGKGSTFYLEFMAE